MPPEDTAPAEEHTDALGAMDSTSEAQDKLPRQPSILKRSRSEGESPSPRTPDIVAEAADEEWAENIAESPDKDVRTGHTNAPAPSGRL